MHSTTTTDSLSRDRRIAQMRARRAAEQAATVPAASLTSGQAIALPIALPGEHCYPVGHPVTVAAVEPGRNGQTAVTVAADFGRVRTFLVPPATPVRVR